MNLRAPRWLAWFLVGLYFSLITIGLVLQRITQTFLLDLDFSYLLLISLALGLLTIVGAIIVWRLPGHLVGWLACLSPLFGAMNVAVFGYAYYAYIAYPGSLPTSDIFLIWLSGSGSSIGLLAALFIFLLFPTGQLLTPRWRIVGQTAITAAIIFALVASLEPGPLKLLPLLSNPVGANEPLWAVLEPIMWFTMLLFMITFLAASISLIVRFRRTKGDERQQIKWFASAAIFFPLSVILLTLGAPGSGFGIIWVYQLSFAIQLLVFIGMPVAIAIAIFKYRLYDIDIIINRTLVYGALSTVLAIVYLVSVALLQNLFRSITAQGSPIAIVISTLLIASLFQPLRIGLQDFIDRRFFRRKYDVEKTLAQFGASLREDVELEMLTRNLMGVIEETIQPEHISLWMRPTD